MELDPLYVGVGAPIALVVMFLTITIVFYWKYHKQQESNTPQEVEVLILITWYVKWELQWKPLNVITLGEKTDNINRMTKQMNDWYEKVIWALSIIWPI